MAHRHTNFEDLDQENALATVGNWNTYCSNGYDEEFQDNPSILHPIDTPPFYGSFVDASSLVFLTVTGGLRTNSDMQVCDENDSPIEGLVTSIATSIRSPSSGKTLALPAVRCPICSAKTLQSSNVTIEMGWHFIGHEISTKSAGPQ